MNALSELLAICKDLAAGVIHLADLPGVLRELAGAIERGGPEWGCWPAPWPKVDSSQPTAPRKATKTPRGTLAVMLARQRGYVTSSELATESGVSREAARVTLATLARDGQLEPVSDRRGRKYVAP